MNHAPLTDWFRNRGGPRLAFGGIAALCAIALSELHNQTVAARPRPEALLFPPIAPSHAPSMAAVALPVPTPASSSPIPATPAPEFAAEQTVTVNVARADLKAADLSVSGNDTATTWHVKRIQRIDTRASYTSAKALSALLLFDQSGSIMQSDNQNRRIPAAQHLVRGLPVAAHVAMSHFPAEGGFLFSSQGVIADDVGFTDDKQEVVNQIGQLPHPDGATPLFSALMASIDKLGQEADRQRVLVCLTDGVPMGDPGSFTNSDVASAARAASVRLFFITLGSFDGSVHRQLARITGGDVIPATNASQLDRAFQKIASKVSRTTTSRYVVTLEARRKGKAFQTGETADGIIAVRGNSDPHPFHVVLP